MLFVHSFLCLFTPNNSLLMCPQVNEIHCSCDVERLPPTGRRLAELEVVTLLSKVTYLHFICTFVIVYVSMYVHTCVYVCTLCILFVYLCIYRACVYVQYAHINVLVCTSTVCILCVCMYTVNSR